MLGLGMNLVTTVIGFGMSIAFIVFICARLLCGRIRSAESRAAAAAGAPTAYDLELQSEPDAVPEHSVDGLEPVVVASLPVVKYQKGSSHSREDGQCSICLGDYQEKEVLRIMPYCGHDFHLICIDEWLEKQSTCPICRLSLHGLIKPKCAAASPFSRRIQSVEIARNHLSSHENSGIDESNNQIHHNHRVNFDDAREG